MHPAVLALAPALLALAPSPSAQEVRIPFQRFELGNGLNVVIHEDHSDPLVAVYVYYHVGSAREVPGRSGFAHLFEHMMFQGSQHVGDDEHFRLVQEAGGTLNGTTNGDRTNYFEVLPSNQLELALWLEADRMGFLLPAMTQEKLDNQREVVKNERRQSYENRPYGLVRETIARNLYPADHPYSWTTIGSMADLTAASLEDVRSFFQRWYGPNNATLAIGGDVDTEEALALVERYFGPLPRGPQVEKPRPRPTELPQTRRVILEDRVELPQLSWTWPTVELDHPDEPALNLLASVLSANKAAILDRALTIDAQLATTVQAYHSARELAGSLTITLRPRPGVSLDRLEARMTELLVGLAAEGVDPDHLQRLKNQREADAVRGLESVSSRTSRLAHHNTFRGDPGYTAIDLARHEAVTTEDVLAVLRRYVVDRPAVVISVVPAGELDLAATGRTPQEREREEALDRAAQPGAGPTPALRVPPVWHATLANGVSVVGTPFDEIPLTRLSLSVPAGRLREDLSTLGLSALTADLLDEGTRRLSSTELLEAFEGLGATFRVRSDDDEITFSVSVLNKHLERAVALLGEVLLEPRLSDEDFERIQAERLTDLRVRADSIRSIAGDVWQALTYGRDTVAGSPGVGTPQTISSLTVEDVRSFWRRNATPIDARLTFVGALDDRGVVELFGSIASRWSAPDTAAVVPASFVAAESRFPEETRVYLVDKPGAAQSEIRIGHPGISALHADHFALQILNHPLGGSFSSRINLNLREDKGYTYGARSRFSGGISWGPFTASAGVRTDVTKESVVEFMAELEGILEGVTEEELAFTKSALVQAMGRRYESTRALQTFLEDVSKYGYPDDYPRQRLELIESIGTDDLAELAQRYVRPGHMAILVVGDKERILAGLSELPFGSVIELGPSGRPIEQ